MKRNNTQTLGGCGRDCYGCPHLVPDDEVYYGQRMQLGPDYCELGYKTNEETSDDWETLEKL